MRGVKEIIKSFLFCEVNVFPFESTHWMFNKIREKNSHEINYHEISEHQRDNMKFPEWKKVFLKKYWKI